MKTVCLDLHCHSTCSDGALAPQQLAEAVAAVGVRVAALTDHDSVEGLTAFGAALKRLGVGHITGVEVTTQQEGQELHILAFGFDPGSDHILELLKRSRKTRAVTHDGVEQALRGQNSVSGAPAPDTAAAIRAVHAAGGKAFLAHPLDLPGDATLEQIASDLKGVGLDGIEVYYSGYTDAQTSFLRDMAHRLGLLCCGGSDFHGTALGPSKPCVHMPADDWVRLRETLSGQVGHSSRSRLPAPRTRAHTHWRSFAFHFLVPSLLAVVLFATAMFGLLLPAFEHSLLQRKREMIRELTNSAWSILVEYEREEQAGRLGRAQAQEAAAERIRYLRYGKEGKDYFWIQDLHPRIIMHPYRKDLNGRDVSDFRDARGVRIFSEFAKLVQRQGEGYISYVWQWKDDPSRLAPKESYIKGFRPWGWVIGTGIYTQDVQAEIARIEGRLWQVAIGITLLVVFVLLYVVQQSLALERGRSEALEDLRLSRERYRSLVEATTEGTLLAIARRCSYANPTMLGMLGLRQSDVALLELVDVLPDCEDNEQVWREIGRVEAGDGIAGSLEGAMQRRDGALVPCLITLSPIAYAGRSGIILMAREIRMGGASEPEALRRLGQAAQDLPLAVCRARATGRGVILEMNGEASGMLAALAGEGSEARYLADLFPSDDEFEALLKAVQQKGETGTIVHLSPAGGRARLLAMACRLSDAPGDEPPTLSVALEDVTEREAKETEREALVERLQTSLMFLHDTVDGYAGVAARCSVGTPVQAAATQMQTEEATAVLVSSGSGNPVGIVTDRDVRERIVAAGAPLWTPVEKIMSAPLITIGARARVYEALLSMEEHGVGHLALVDDSGLVTGVVRGASLLRFRSYGPTVVTREIRRAPTPEDVAKHSLGAGQLAGVLVDTGARPDAVTHMLTAICDGAAARFCELAAERLGPAPVPFVFIALGSHGRREMTLTSDQDNGIIFDAPKEGLASQQAEKYFRSWADMVCGWMNDAGYRFCPGDVMATNPRWRQPLDVWKEYFRRWVRTAEPQELLDFATFFDFRAVWGEAALTRELRRVVRDELLAAPAFFGHFAQSALQFRPPLRVFGRVLGASEAGLDLKEAAMAVTAWARLYALRHDVAETGTLARLEALGASDVLPEASVQEAIEAYESLMRIRLRHQWPLHEDRQPANLVSPARMTRTEESLLRSAFAQITAMQKRISYDFLGGQS